MLIPYNIAYIVLLVCDWYFSLENDWSKIQIWCLYHFAYLILINISTFLLNQIVSFWFHLNAIPTCVIFGSITCPYVLQYTTTNYTYDHIVVKINFPDPGFIGTVTYSWRYIISSLISGEWTWHCVYPIWPRPGFSMIFQDEISYESLYVSFWYIMKYMDLVIVKVDFNDRYGNNVTCVEFII